jgi:hypothetical protein
LAGILPAVWREKAEERVAEDRGQVFMVYADGPGIFNDYLID